MQQNSAADINYNEDTTDTCSLVQLQVVKALF